MMAASFMHKNLLHLCYNFFDISSCVCQNEKSKNTFRGECRGQARIPYENRANDAIYERKVL